MVSSLPANESKSTSVSKIRVSQSFKNESNNGSDRIAVC